MRHKHSVTDNPGQLAGIAALAAAIGATVAMLFTPRNGRQVRGGLRRRAEHLKDDVQHKFDADTVDAGDTVESITDKVKTTVDKVTQDSKVTADKLKADAAKKKAELDKAAKDAQ